jgi:hypothetical protein
LERYFYYDEISAFLDAPSETIQGHLANNSDFPDEVSQKNAWRYEISILKQVLKSVDGSIFFEFSIPRMGKRIDVLLLVQNALFVLEFKVGEKKFNQYDLDQVWDYALDLKNFHETSHQLFIAPILIATEANTSYTEIIFSNREDNLLDPVKANSNMLRDVINKIVEIAHGRVIETKTWLEGRYSPTPTIIEAAVSLFHTHSVANISRSDASAKNLNETSTCVSSLIEKAKANDQKIICFVTGVPGAGKTLVGLNIATQHLDKERSETSVFLSGNGPLVAILREALTRDKVAREKQKGNKITKKDVLRYVKAFIQNVHHFRDEYLRDLENPPFDHVAIFDEAQRAWNHAQTASFMKRKKNRPNFQYSEPEFLISCLDRHKDWAVIVCLVGGGQEINVGEAGISEWIESLSRSFPQWHVYVSNKLTEGEYNASESLKLLSAHQNVVYLDQLHLNVSMRSFRAENVSELVKNILDRNINHAKQNLTNLRKRYPIVLTRDLQRAKQWLKSKARGSERYGIVVSSQAQRLKPHAIDVKSPMDPVKYFLNEKYDIRSCYYLEDVATEFDVQGMELDWSCITWDGDFRYSDDGWGTFEFRGNKWQKISKPERKNYLKNAYRVLLTRARQGMVIVVPNGSTEDPTRNPDFYDGTYQYLLSLGIDLIPS